MTPLLFSLAMLVTLAHCQTAVQILCIGSNDSAESAANAQLLFAADFVNNNLSELLPGLQINITYLTTNGVGAGSAVKAFIDGYLNQRPCKTLLLGPTHSNQALMVADLASYYYLPQISYTPIGPELTRQDDYPYLVRLSVSRSSMLPAVICLLREYRWQRVGILTTDSEEFYRIVEQLEEQLILNNMTEYEKSIYTTDISSALRKLLEHEIRIFIINLDRSISMEHFGCLLNQLSAYGKSYVYVHIGCFQPADGLSPSCDAGRALEGAIALAGVVPDDWSSDGNDEFWIPTRLIHS